MCCLSSQVENCNLAVALGKELGLSLPGLGGECVLNRVSCRIFGTAIIVSVISTIACCDLVIRIQRVSKISFRPVRQLRVTALLLLLYFYFYCCCSC